MEHVTGGRPTSFRFVKSFAARRSNEGPAALQDPGDGIPIHHLDMVPAFHQTLVALVDGEDFRPFIKGSTHHGAYCRVHSLGISTAGQYCNSFCSHACFQTPDNVLMVTSQ